MDISCTVSFIDICNMLEKIKCTNKAEKKQHYLRKYFDSFEKHRNAYLESQGLKMSDEQGVNTSIYCVLRCLIPNADKDRRIYGLQVTTLGKTYIKILKLKKDSKEARTLVDYRGFGRQVDYAELVHRVLQIYCRNTPSTLSLHEVHSMLDSIAEGDRENTNVVLTRLSETASANEQKWFIRLLLKSMNLGIGEQNIFRVLHPQAQQLFYRCSSLQILCTSLLKEPSACDNDSNEETKNVIELNSIIQPFHHVKPMLCEIFPGNIESLMAADVLYMETKQDGERFQLHYANGRFEYFSRNGVCYTNSFGADYKSGALTPFLKGLLPVGMVSLILDGEMMVWDTEELCYRDKGENTDVKHLAFHQKWRPCFVVYDLLYLNGRSLLNLSYVQRTYKLRECMREQVSVLQIMKSLKVTSIQDFKDKYQHALDSNEEGVVLKMQKSTYRAGVRNGGGWYKVKADYIEGLTSDFDLIIMGGFYNKSRTFIESFLLGVLKYIKEDNFEVYSVAKVPNNTRRRRVLNDILRQHWRTLSNDPPPTWYHYAKHSAEGRPDVWIEPSQSTVLLIKATDLGPSKNFALLKSLHFPRILAWRNDKVWNECTTLLEYMQMCQLGKRLKKINKRELTLEDILSNQRKRKLTLPQRRKQFYETFGSKIETTATSVLFEGFSFCILSGNFEEGLTPEYLKELILKNGGRLIENPIPHDPLCISVAGEITCRVNKLIMSASVDIVSAAWLVKTCNRQYLMLSPHDMIFSTADMIAQFEHSFDIYGDSYSQPVDENDLLVILSQMDCRQILETKHTFLEPDITFWVNETIGKIQFFSNYHAVFFDCGENVKHLFKFRGGKIHKAIGFLVDNLENQDLEINNNIVFCQCAKSMAKQIRQQLNNFNKKECASIKIIDVQWIYVSHCSNKLEDVHSYIL